MRSGFCSRDLCTDETRGPTHDRCRKDDCSCCHHDEDYRAKWDVLLERHEPFGGEPEQPRPMWDATAEIAYAAVRLSGEAKVIGDMTAEEAMRVLYGLRDALDNLRDVEAALVQRVYLAGEHGDVRIEGLPPAKVQRARDRKNWDSRGAVFAYLDQRLSEMGEVPDPATVADWVLEICGVSYLRVTPLKERGLKPEDFCDSSPGRISVTFTD